MHIVRFIDDKGRECYGHDYSNGKALRLAGDLFSGLAETGEKVNVKILEIDQRGKIRLSRKALLSE